MTLLGLVTQSFLLGGGGGGVSCRWFLRVVGLVRMVRETVPMCVCVCVGHEEVGYAALNPKP